MNMKFSKDGMAEKWIINTEAIDNNIQNIFDFVHVGEYHGPFCGLVGGKSNSFEFSDYSRVFPNITEDDIVIVKDAGHWVH